MKNKIIKLVRRLNKFTIEDIEPPLQLDRTEIKNILKELVVENILFKNDGLYIYQKEKIQQTKQPGIFQYHTKESINIIIRGFCVEIVPEKLALLVDVSSDSINKFYIRFRTRLFEKQTEKLEGYNKEKSQTAWCRKFFNQAYYFYSYFRIYHKMYIRLRFVYMSLF